MDFLKTIDSGGDDGGDGGGGEENVELSLGLSLNGRFGVERRRKVVANDYLHKNNNNDNRIIRAASSVAELSSFEDPTMTLTRTCSLPMEAKRKRVDEKIQNGKGLLHPLKRVSPLTSVGSPASGGSSGVSDLESQPFSGRNKDVELKSTASQHSILHKIPSPSPYRANSIVSDRSTSSDETLKMLFADMPCVSTKGDGVNGKKIEGFLYRYRKGEEVRIVCVCHGHFLTPAEFVKHGGGGDVENPLRHIVVNPPSP